jgi:hypothetical protein
MQFVSSSDYPSSKGSCNVKLLKPLFTTGMASCLPKSSMAGEVQHQPNRQQEQARQEKLGSRNWFAAAFVDRLAPSAGHTSLCFVAVGYPASTHGSPSENPNNQSLPRRDSRSRETLFRQRAAF